METKKRLERPELNIAGLYDMTVRAAECSFPKDRSHLHSRHPQNQTQCLQGVGFPRSGYGDCRPEADVWGGVPTRRSSKRIGSGKKMRLCSSP